MQGTGVIGVVSDTELLLNLPDAILLLDSQDNIIRTTGAFEYIFGRDGNSVVGRSIFAIVADDQLRKMIDRIRRRDTAVSLRDITLTGLPFTTDKLDVYGHLIVDGSLLLTVSQRSLPGHVDKRSQLRRATMTAKGMAAMLAHEIKNPLSGIKGAAQLVSRKLEDKQKRLTDVIVKEVDRIRQIVDDLETFTNPSSVEIKSINIHETIDHAVDLALAGFASNALLRREYDPSLPDVAGNFDQLVQVYLNLLKNAIEAAGDNHSEITIKTAYKHGLWLNGDGGKKSRLCIEVTFTDNGPGISEDIRKHLFDPFVTNKEGGSGLGLAVVAQSLTNMGGIVECQNRKRHQGARFTIHLQSYSDYIKSREENIL